MQVRVMELTIKHKMAGMGCSASVTFVKGTVDVYYSATLFYRNRLRVTMIVEYSRKSTVCEHEGLSNLFCSYSKWIERLW